MTGALGTVSLGRGGQDSHLERESSTGPPAQRSVADGVSVSRGLPATQEAPCLQDSPLLAQEGRMPLRSGAHPLPVAGPVWSWSRESWSWESSSRAPRQPLCSWGGPCSLVSPGLPKADRRLEGWYEGSQPPSWDWLCSL